MDHRVGKCAKKEALYEEGKKINVEGKCKT